MTSVTANPCTITFQRNNNDHAYTGELKISPQNMQFSAGNSFDLSIEYTKLHMFATGNNSNYLMVVTDDENANEDPDRDSDYTPSVEYKFEANNIDVLYQAIVENQALYPTGEEEEDEGAQMMESEQQEGLINPLTGESETAEERFMRLLGGNMNGGPNGQINDAGDQNGCMDEENGQFDDA